MAQIIRLRVVLVVVISLASAMAFAQSSGSEIYIPKCAGCHGTNGIVASEYMKSRGTPNATDPYIQSLTAKQMFSSVKNGREGSIAGMYGMRPFKNKLTDAEIREAVTYYRELGSVSGAQAQETQASPKGNALTPERLEEQQKAIHANEKIKLLNQMIAEARTLKKEGKYTEAVATMEEAVKLDQSHEVIYSELADCYMGAKKYPEAETAYRKALELASPNSQKLEFYREQLATIQQAQITPLKLPALYVSGQTPADQLHLNADNSFSLQEGRQPYHGTFAANGATIELNISETSTKTTLRREGDNLTDSSGQTWSHRDQSAGTAAPSGATLHNEDIIKLAKVGTDDATITAKIKGSKCQFDTSTDALVLLKKSGVSAAVLKAMVGVGAKDVQ